MVNMITSTRTTYITYCSFYIVHCTFKFAFHCILLKLYIRRHRRYHYLEVLLPEGSTKDYTIPFSVRLNSVSNFTQVI